MIGPNLIEMQADLESVSNQEIQGMASGQVRSIAPIWMVNLEVERRNRINQPPSNVPTQTVSQQNLAELSGQGGMPQQPGGQGAMPQQAPVMAARGGVMRPTGSGSSNPFFQLFDSDFRRNKEKEAMLRQVNQLRDAGYSKDSLLAEIMKVPSYIPGRPSLELAQEVISEIPDTLPDDPGQRFVDSTPMHRTPGEIGAYQQGQEGVNVAAEAAAEAAAELKRQREADAVAKARKKIELDNNVPGNGGDRGRDTLGALKRSNNAEGQTRFQQRQAQLEEYINQSEQEAMQPPVAQRQQGSFVDRGAGYVSDVLRGAFDPKNASLWLSAARGVAEAAERPGQSVWGSLAGVGTYTPGQMDIRRKLAIDEQNARNLAEQYAIHARSARSREGLGLMNLIEKGTEREFAEKETALNRAMQIKIAEIQAGSGLSNREAIFNKWVKRDKVAESLYMQINNLRTVIAAGSDDHKVRSDLEKIERQLLRRFNNALQNNETTPFESLLQGEGGPLYRLDSSGGQ